MYTNKYAINKIYIISLERYLGWVFETPERKKDRPLVTITIPIPQSTPSTQIHPLQDNIHVSKYIHFKTTFMCPATTFMCLAGVPSSQALPGFLITAHHLCAFLLQLEG